MSLLTLFLNTGALTASCAIMTLKMPCVHIAVSAWAAVEGVPEY